jgi:hypothetical protein
MGELTIPGLDASKLEVVLAGLEEIEAHFDNEGFSGGSSVHGEIKSGHGNISSDESEPEDTYDLPDVFDAEEIEIAIDAFLSRLIKAKVIKKSKPTPAISDVFESWLGPDHEIVKAASRFENHVSGYFGWVSYEDMSSAYDYFREMKEALEQLREGDLFE